MSAKKLKKPKQKAVSLQEFTASLEPTQISAGQNIIYAPKKPMISSWADEVEEYELITEKERIVLPSAPRASRGPAYEDSQIPRVPPFKAHLGNISYEIEDEEVYRFFNGLDIDELRLPRDTNNRLRGFGYVEFRNREDLIEALIMNERILRGRPIRISLGTGHSDGARKVIDETPADWRASTGNHHVQDKMDFGRSQSQPFYGRDKRVGVGGGNKLDYYNKTNRPEYYGGFGKFESQTHSYQRQFSDGNDFYHDSGPSRGARMAPPRGDFDTRSRDYNHGGGNNGAFYTQRDDDRGNSRSNEDLGRAPFQPRLYHPEQPSSMSSMSHDMKRPLRTNEVHADGDEPRMKSPTSPQSPPRERKRLVLQPRTKQPSESEPVVANPAIFGDAKPVDTASREREIEKKLSEISLLETKKLRILPRPKPEVQPPIDFVQKKTDTSQRFRRDSNSRSGPPPPPLMAEPSSPPPRLLTQPVSLARRRRSDEIDRDKDTNSEPEDERDLRLIEFQRVDSCKGRGDGDWRNSSGEHAHRAQSGARSRAPR